MNFTAQRAGDNTFFLLALALWVAQYSKCKNEKCHVGGAGVIQLNSSFLFSQIVVNSSW